MTQHKIRIVHYINQFFGGIGGEDKADFRPEERSGFVGPGQVIQASLGDTGEIVATIICGDGFFNENIEEAKSIVASLIAKHKPDMVIAGPAFNAGRYGVACGAVAEAISEKHAIPVISAMHPENPGVELYKRHAYILETGKSAAEMRKVAPQIAKLAKAIFDKEEITPETHGIIPRGIRKNFFHKERGAKRAVEMLKAKLAQQPFKTEYPMPVFDRVTPNPPVLSVRNAKIAILTSGGIVPKGNPDRIESSSASKYGKYTLAGLTDLTSDSFETAHGGYDPVYANADPDRVLPLDVLREMEKNGEIGELHNYYYATVGNGTSVNNAINYAKSIARDLKNDGIQAAILTST